MALYTRTCARLSQSAVPSAISNADMVSLGTVDLPRFFVGMMESGAKMNLQFCNALVSALENTCPRISVYAIPALVVLIEMNHHHS